MFEKILLNLFPHFSAFAEEEPPQSGTQSAAEYIEAIKNLKENSVDKKEYDKLKDENKTLIKALSGEGELPEIAKEAQQKPDLAALRENYRKISEEGAMNYEVAQAALELRAAAIAAGENDPFIPAGIKVEPTLDDLKGAQKVADALQYCLDEATEEDGTIDPEIFNARFRKILADDSAIITARLGGKKKGRN